MSCFTLFIFHILIGLGMALSVRMTLSTMKRPTIVKIMTFLSILGLSSILLCYFLYFTIPFVAGIIVLLTIYPNARAGRGRYETAGSQGKTIFSGSLHTIDFGEDMAEKGPVMRLESLLLISGFLLFSISGVWFSLFY